MSEAALGGPARVGDVFISHTSELARYPQDRSFVQAAVDAVIAAGRVPVEMGYFAAREGQPVEYCRDQVHRCAVYVGVIGFRYGSLVPGTDVSYTEAEFREAEAAGIPRVVFLLSEETPLPANMFDDDRSAIRAFRDRLRNAGLIVREVSSPDALEAAVFQALVDLARPSASGAVSSTVGLSGLDTAQQDPAAVFAAVDGVRMWA